MSKTISKKKDILVFGCGGHAKSCLDIIEQSEGCRVIGFVGRREEIGLNIGHHTVLTCDEELSELKCSFHLAFIGIGQMASPAPRIKLFDFLTSNGHELGTFQSSSAIISPSAQIGQGTIIMHGAIVNASAVIGKNCIINTKALIEHDCEVGSHCHISTGAILNGGVKVGSGVFVGSSAVVKQGVTIGDGATIKMGEVVTRDVIPDVFRVS